MSRIKAYSLFFIFLIIAFFGIIAGGYLYFYQQAQYDSLHMGIGLQNQALKAENLELRKENEMLRNQLGNANIAPDFSFPSKNDITIEDLNENAGIVDMSEMMKNLLMDNPNAADLEEGSPVAEMMKAFSGFAESPAFNKMIVNQEFSGLFDRLELTPERKEELMAILLENSHNALASTMGIIENDGLHDFDRFREEKEAAEKKLRDAMAKVLTPNELAVFDDYQTNKYEYMQRDNMLTELSYLSNRVSDQSLNQFVDLYLQYDTAPDPFDPEHNVFDPASMGSAIYSQRVETLQLALDQLAPNLTPEEHAVFSQHIELQRMQAAQMEAIFENLGMDETFQEMMQGFGVPMAEGEH
jgi:hypothetical protein